MNCTGCKKRLKNGDEVKVGGPASMGGMGVICEKCCKRRGWTPTAKVIKNGYEKYNLQNELNYTDTWEEWNSNHWKHYGNAEANVRAGEPVDMPEVG